MVAVSLHTISAQLQLSIGIPADATIRYRTHNIAGMVKQNEPSARTQELRFPDPLSCSAYYLLESLGGGTITHMTCPNALIFEQKSRICVSNSNNGCDLPIIHPLVLPSSGTCNGFGFACINHNSFKYCATRNVTILDNKTCPSGYICLIHRTTPCHPYTRIHPRAYKTF
jgi:hypothetical protein